MKTLRFAKYHGAGNDFLLVEDVDGEVEITEGLAEALCDRYRGPGADGVIRITRGTNARYSMELWNADGGRAGMSGNGMRCLARFLLDRGLTRDREISVDTLSGVKRIEVTVEGDEMRSARVDMGPPELERGRIPM